MALMFKQSYPRAYVWLRNLLVLLTLWLVYAEYDSWRNRGLHLWQSYQDPCPGYATGDLGGQLVQIPQEYIDLVEYDPEFRPGWGKFRGQRIPRHNYSKINSTGFWMNAYTGELYKKSKFGDSPKKGFVQGSSWLSVSISAGSRYHGANLFYRSPNFWAAIDSGKLVRDPSMDVAGLEAFQEWGLWKGKKNLSYNPGWSRDYFRIMDNRGTLKTFVNCDSGKGIAETCSQIIDLYPFIKTDIGLLYTRSLLPFWSQMDRYARKALAQFYVKDFSSCHPRD